eukprot:scaffold101184_cov68-Cyclotella_meneghiniana.AAC.8
MDNGTPKAKPRINKRIYTHPFIKHSVKYKHQFLSQIYQQQTVDHNQRAEEEENEFEETTTTL